jgi:hypothetical protein
MEHVIEVQSGQNKSWPGQQKCLMLDLCIGNIGCSYTG